MSTGGKTAIAVLVIIVNLALCLHFVVHISQELLRAFLDLDELHTAEILRLMESRVWPVVAYTGGMWGHVAKGLFLRIVLFLERKLTGRWRAGSLMKTRDRLDAQLNETVRAANWRERLRRATSVANWVLQGLVDTDELAAEVAAYEARGRYGDEEVWREIVEASVQHRAEAEAALQSVGDTVGLELRMAKDGNAAVAALRVTAAQISRRITGKHRGGGYGEEEEEDDPKSAGGAAGYDDDGGAGQQYSKAAASWLAARPSADDASWHAPEASGGGQQQQLRSGA